MDEFYVFHLALSVHGHFFTVSVVDAICGGVDRGV